MINNGYNMLANHIKFEMLEAKIENPVSSIEYLS